MRGISSLASACLSIESLKWIKFGGDSFSLATLSTADDCRSGVNSRRRKFALIVWETPQMKKISLIVSRRLGSSFKFVNTWCNNNLRSFKSSLEFSYCIGVNSSLVFTVTVLSSTVIVVGCSAARFLVPRRTVVSVCEFGQVSDQVVSIVFISKCWLVLSFITCLRCAKIVRWMMKAFSIVYLASVFTVAFFYVFRKTIRT